MFYRFGPTELILVLIIVMIIFGVGKLPQVGGALGKAIREFRQAQAGDDARGGPSASADGTGASEARGSADREAQ